MIRHNQRRAGIHEADIDRALAAWRQGDRGAADDLFRLVYDELRISAARAMRMVVVDHWRRKHSRKRGPQPVSVGLEDVAMPDAMPRVDIPALDEALR